MNFPVNSAMQRVHVIVSGHVQGVGFRYFVKESAESLQLTGWVRNMTNGNVELLAEGDHETLQTFINRVRQGNALSYISDLEIHWLPAGQQHHKFMIAPSE